ncbi:helicase HerA-like domain-containing protein [Parvularcula marina]|uniref:helicase HerA-like domain-containing protein n=1 Tax=Parvularcula marina TaxID=2292771 RepID=UPI00351477F7
MSEDGKIFLGASDQDVELALKYANRHGLISGATGTGKTVTLQIITEGFSNAGVPVFVADVKGDLSGLAVEGAEPEKDFLYSRAEQIGLDGYGPAAMPVVFWDLFGEKGHPVRATVTEMGPLLLSQMLELNSTQEGVLAVTFRVADEEGLPLLDLEDLRALLTNVAERRAELSARYGNVSAASVAAIQRRLLQLEDQGAKHFFGEPRLDLNDFFRTTRDGRGHVNILAADRLMMTPKLYATFLLWLLSELFEELPEIGDPEKPILVFFFDEAHLLFDDAPPALLDRIEQVVRLIRSKGVGVFFSTQSPLDVPDSVSRQLGNRVQHALRAYTPKERRAVRAAAETFRPNPDFNSVDVITELGIGEALVSTLLKKGVPAEVERTLIRPPSSRLGPATDTERTAIMKEDGLGRIYDEAIDRHSAAEILAERAERAAEEAEAAEKRAAKEKERSRKTKTSSSRSRSRRMSSTEKAVNQAVRTGTSTLIRELIRGVLGGLKRR